MSEPVGTQANLAGTRLPPGRAALALASIVALVVMIVSANGTFEGLNRLVADRRMRRDDRAAAAAGSAVSQQVAVVAVPPEERGAWWSGDAAGRRRLAAVVRRLHAAGARCLVLNVTLDTPGDAAADAALAEAFRVAGMVVLRAQVDSPRPSMRGLTLPLRAFRVAAAAYGYTYWIADDDGVVRHFTLALPEAAELSLPTAAWAIAAGQEPEAVRQALRADTELPGGRRAPADLRVNFVFRGPPGEGFVTIPLAELPRRAGELRGKAVVLGGVDSSQGGLNVPLSAAWRPTWLDRWPEPMTATELLASALDTLLSGTDVDDLGGLALYLLVFLAAFAVSLAALGLGSGPAAVTGLALAILWVGLSAALHHWVRLFLPVGEAIVAMAACLGAGLYQSLHRQMVVHRGQAVAAETERRRLAELDGAKRAVLGTVVHDLKVPVAIIKGQALTLAADPERELGEDVHHEFLTTIAAQCDRLTAMIEDILDTDPDRALTVYREPCDLVKLVRHVVEMHEATANRHTFRVAATELAPQALDPAKIARVLNNLISNAVKYSPAGGEVVVTVRPGESAGAEVAVRDQGLGMTPEQMARLFGLFVRVVEDPAAIPGTGVGLYSAKRLVEAHGGHLEVASEPGRGSEFTVFLPGAPAAAPRPLVADA